MSSYTEALQELIKKIDLLAGTAGSVTTGSIGRQEEILTAVSQVNGFVREHGEMLAAHQQWLESHGEAHTAKDKDFRTLSSRVWVLGGGTGILATVAMILQFLNL